MLKRILSVLLCFALCCALLPVTTAQAKTVKTVEIIGVVPPTHGQAPTFDAHRGNGDYDDCYYIKPDVGGQFMNGVAWRDVTDNPRSKNYMNRNSVFEYGRRYEVTVCLGAMQEDSFQTSSVDGYPTVKGKLNGMSAEVSNLGGFAPAEVILVSFVFTCGPAVIDSAAVENVAVPCGDRLPDFGVSVPEGAEYAVWDPVQGSLDGAVRWYDADESRRLEASERFVTGHSYRVEVMLTRTAAHSQFAVDLVEKPKVEATLNGDVARVDLTAGASARDSITVCYTFPPCQEGPIRLERIELGGIVQPYVGMVPNYGVSELGEGFYVVGDQWHELTHNGVTWVNVSHNADYMADNETFAQNLVYRVEIHVHAKPGYEFRRSEAGAVLCKAYLGGLEGTLNESYQWDSAQELTAVFYFDPCTPGTVQLTRVAVEGVVPPAAGEEPACRATAVGTGYAVPEDSVYTNGVRWLDLTEDRVMQETERFQMGRSYRVEVMLKTAPYYAFADDGEGVSGTVNGDPAKLSQSPGDQTASFIILQYDFPALSVTGIGDVEAAIESPVIGRRLSYEGAVPPDANWHIEPYNDGHYHNGVFWYNPETGEPIDENAFYTAGVSYGVCFLLAANDGCAFSEQPSGSVNGQSASAQLFGDNLLLRFVFVPVPGAPEDCGGDAALCPSLSKFVDAPPYGNWAHDAIDWALVNGVTTGTSKTKFSPAAVCTRAQIVTFLWRANGKPEPLSFDNPFDDVPEDKYYYKAVLWAVENKITTGMSATKFRPDAGCTRAQVVTFLWRANGEPEPNTSGNPFEDVPEKDYYYRALLWAVENRITTGTSANKFSPASTCTRAQIATFLYRSIVQP